MCKVCVEWEAGKLTAKEALRAIGELIYTDKNDKHYIELSEKIMDKEVPMNESDEELDQNWHEETHGSD